MVRMSYMMVPTFTLLDNTLNFCLLFKFNIYKNQIVPTSYWIVPTSHMMILISHLMVPIEWVPYPQKECGYCRMTSKFISHNKGPLFQKIKNKGPLASINYSLKWEDSHVILLTNKKNYFLLFTNFKELRNHWNLKWLICSGKKDHVYNTRRRINNFSLRRASTIILGVGEGISDFPLLSKKTNMAITETFSSNLF